MFVGFGGIVGRSKWGPGRDDSLDSIWSMLRSGASIPLRAEVDELTRCI